MTQEEQIIECENRLAEAMKAGNVKVLDELLHDSLVFNIPNGQTITKAMDLESYSSGNMTVYDILATDRTITTIDSVSTVVVTIHLNAKYADQAIDNNFRFLRIWKLCNDSWKIIAGSSTLI